MAISDPREIPSTPYLEQCGFHLFEQVSQIPLRGGRNPVADLGAPIWTCEVKSVRNVPLAGMREWVAWRNSLRGHSPTFLMYDIDRQYPTAYPSGSGWGSPTVAAFSQANRTIDLQALTASAVITPGDRLSITYGSSSHYAYHEIVEGGTADGSGNLTVTVAEDIRTGIAASDVVNMSKPRCEMVMLPNSWKASDGLGGVGSFSFSAAQVIRA